MPLRSFWFVQTNVMIQVSHDVLDIFSHLDGREESMFDIVSYKWRRDGIPYLQAIVHDIQSLLAPATPEGTYTVWTQMNGLPMRERLAAILLHQLRYNRAITVCYNWDPHPTGEEGGIIFSENVQEQSNNANNNFNFTVGGGQS
jgi:hypothetical protein